VATVTAQILVGQGHPNHGGIDPSHAALLFENDRPGWRLLPLHPEEDSPRIGWTPTTEHMLEDGLLMIAVHVWQPPTLVQALREEVSEGQMATLELYRDMDSPKLQHLHEECRAGSYSQQKVVLTVLEESSIRQQLDVLEGYEIDMEVCIPRYSRLYSRWTDETVISGTLQG
jgi:hypothetical protein